MKEKTTRTVSASVSKETITSVVKYQISTVAIDTRVRITSVVVKHYGNGNTIINTFTTEFTDIFLTQIV